MISEEQMIINIINSLIWLICVTCKKFFYFIITYLKATFGGH